MKHFKTIAFAVTVLTTTPGMLGMEEDPEKKELKYLKIYAQKLKRDIICKSPEALEDYLAELKEVEARIAKLEPKKQNK